MIKLVGAWFSALLVFLLVGIAHASEDYVAGSVGDSANGLPGIGRVAVATQRAPRFSLGLAGGYGFTEPQPGDSGPHHRLLGTIGLAIQPLDFLSASLTFDGRYDKHPNDALGPDDGLVGDPRFTLRAAHAIGRAFALGGQVVVWVPGADAPSLTFAGTTVDAQLLATVAPPRSPIAIAITGGYRFDQSTASVYPPLDRMRPGDRLALMISQYDAVLLGLGVSARVRDVELLAEMTWDILVGSGAPSATTSPWRIAAGARWHVSPRVQLELRTEVTLSDRPPLGPTEPLVPVEPRFNVIAGLRWDLPLTKAPAQASPGPPVVAPEHVTPPPPSGRVQGHVLGEDGHAIAGAHVMVSSGGVERTADTDSAGAYAIADAPVGAAHVTAKADDYADASSEATVSASAPASVDFKLKHVVHPGQLRGLVRGFNGKPLAATIRVEPIGLEAHTDADGRFQLDVPPGPYEVSIVSPGHASQKRPVRVEENGVTILNADLRAGK